MWEKILGREKIKRVGVGVGIFLAKERVYKVINISTESDRMIVIKVLVQGILISMILIYATQFSFDNQKNYF